MIMIIKLTADGQNSIMHQDPPPSRAPREPIPWAAAPAFWRVFGGSAPSESDSPQTNLDSGVSVPWVLGVWAGRRSSRAKTPRGGVVRGTPPRLSRCSRTPSRLPRAVRERVSAPRVEKQAKGDGQNEG